MGAREWAKSVARSAESDAPRRRLMMDASRWRVERRLNLKWSAPGVVRCLCSTHLRQCSKKKKRKTDLLAVRMVLKKAVKWCDDAECLYSPRFVCSFSQAVCLIFAACLPLPVRSLNLWRRSRRDSVQGTRGWASFTCSSLSLSVPLSFLLASFPAPLHLPRRHKLVVVAGHLRLTSLRALSFLCLISDSRRAHI